MACRSRDIADALTIAEIEAQRSSVDEIVVIGGGEVYAETLPRALASISRKSTPRRPARHFSCGSIAAIGARPRARAHSKARANRSAIPSSRWSVADPAIGYWRKVRPVGGKHCVQFELIDRSRSSRSRIPVTTDIIRTSSPSWR